MTSLVTLILVLHGLGSGTWEGEESRTQLLAEQLRDGGVVTHLGDPQGGHAVGAPDARVRAGRQEEFRARALVAGYAVSKTDSCFVKMLHYY